jgi:outer membrane biosynthesis protein TonB
MANSPQDQASKPALSNPSASGSAAPCSNGSGPASRRILLAIRLRTQDSSGSPAGVSWVADEPAAALVMDLISASGGVPDEPWGAVLAARFADLQSALLTVRRLQWALEGLNESAASAATAASVVLDSLEDPAVAAATVRMLEHMAAGEVLVGAALADALQPLPGVTLRATDNGNWRELLWHGAEASQGFAADEQSVLSLIRKLGREDPGPLQIDLPRPTAETTPAAPEDALSERLGRSSLEPEPAPGFGRWLIVGGAAAVVVLIAALVIGGMVFGKHGKTAPPPPDISHKPAAPAPPPMAVPVVEKTRESRPPAKPAKQPRSEPKTEPRPESRSESRPAAAPSPRTPAVPCDLTEADIPRTLSRAESYMYAGKLTEAQAIFQRLLPCSSAHDKAQEGLDRVRQRIAAQSP